MKNIFKKALTIAGSALMVGSTVALAAAANYPAPFVQNGAADVAIVYGSNAAASDSAGATSIQADLSSELASQASGGTVTISGESYALFTSSSKIYLNGTLNAVRTTLTDTELPSVLEDGDFEGDVSADYTQTITLGSNPTLVYGQHPTSDNDPVVAFSLSTSTGSPVYNMTVSFDQAVNFTSSDSIGEELTIFGKTFTVGAGSTTAKLYLYESSETVALSIGGADPASAEVTVDDVSYTVELIAGSDTAATIKVTNSAGKSDSKEVSEDSSKKINGLDIAVNRADESEATNSITTEITIGANKVLLQDGNAVKMGSDEDQIDNTLVTRTATTDWTDTTGFTISVAAEDTDVDAIVQGGKFEDRVFGGFSVVFSDLANDDDRETIKVAPSGADKATLEMTTHTGDSQKITWYNNDSVTARLADGGDSGNDRIKVLEGETVNITQYVVVGNEDEGYLLELKTLSNSSGDRNDDIVFEDVFSGDDYSVTGITTEGTGNLIVGGKTYVVNYYDETAEGADYVTLNYPDTSSTSKVLYPTIQTSKGARVAFYEPKTLTLGTTIGSGQSLYLPDGDGYTTATLTILSGAAGNCTWAVTGAATDTLNTSDSTDVVDLTIGQLTYQLQGTGTDNQTTVYLEDVAGTNITLPGLVVFEEQNDESTPVYEALIVKMEGAGTSSASVGVEDVERTWSTDSTSWEFQLESDDDMYREMDLWGAVITTDKSDSDQYNVEISYPDEQIDAEVYVAEASAVTISNELGNIRYMDSEATSYANKNLIVVGGSCINSVAADLLGSAACEGDFTGLTDVSAGEFLIQSFSRSGKTALLVAGYNAADTTKAVTALLNEDIDTTVGKKYVSADTTGTSVVEA